MKPDGKSSKNGGIKAKKSKGAGKKRKDAVINGEPAKKRKFSQEDLSAALSELGKHT